jgi:hypothetical protein
MVNDEKLILHEKERKGFMFVPMGSVGVMPVPVTVPAHDSVVKKPKGVFNINMAMGALVFGAIALALAPAALSSAALVAVTAASSIAGGVLAGTASEIYRRKKYSRALEQKYGQQELPEGKALTPGQAETIAQDTRIERETGRKFQRIEEEKRSVSAAQAASASL